MRILMLADLHGNLPAMQKLDELNTAIPHDETWFLGDAVGKGPHSCETCDWVRTHCDHFVGGNWDFGIGNREFPGDRYYWDMLGEDRLHWLRSLPSEDELTLSGVRFRIFHGRPVTQLLQGNHPDELLQTTLHTDKGDFGGVIFADSHRPFVRTVDQGYVCNTGSVGNSLGVTRVHALLLEGGASPADPLMIQIISAPYDNEKAAALARADELLPKGAAYVREVLTGIYSR